MRKSKLKSIAGIRGYVVIENKSAAVLWQRGNGFWYTTKNNKLKVFGGTKNECLQMFRTKGGTSEKI